MTTIDDLEGDSCPICGTSLEGKRIDAVYCSARCRRKSLTILEQEARWEGRPDRQCVECGKPVPPQRRADAKYCGKRCMDRARHRRTVVPMLRESKEGRTCLRCDEPIPAAKPLTAVYCSKACNQAAYVERRTRAWRLLQIVEAMEASGDR